jgi:hypothetical protein
MRPFCVCLCLKLRPFVGHDLVVALDVGWRASCEGLLAFCAGETTWRSALVRPPGVLRVSLLCVTLSQRGCCFRS